MFLIVFIFRARFLISSKMIVAMDLTLWKCGGMSRICLPIGNFRLE